MLDLLLKTYLLSLVFCLPQVPSILLLGCSLSIDGPYDPAGCKLSCEVANNCDLLAVEGESIRYILKSLSMAKLLKSAAKTSSSCLLGTLKVETALLRLKYSVIGAVLI